MKQTEIISQDMILKSQRLNSFNEDNKQQKGA